MKKQILFLVMMLLPMVASTQNFARIDGVYYKLNTVDKTAEVVTSPFRYTGNVVIPSSVAYEGVDYCVTGIGDQAFYASADLTSVSIPNSVAGIGNNIFQGCTGLASIVIEEGNTVYDSRENCNAIIETASNKLLYGCQNSIIPNSVASIANSAFNGCSGLTSIIIPDGVTSIGENAFKDCSNLKKVEINSNTIVSKRYEYNVDDTSIKKIFGNQVEEYVLGEDVTSIGDGAFFGCPNLISFYMSDNVTSIGEHAFTNCYELVSIHISDNLTSMGGFAFCNCYHLASINIPSSLTSIDQWTFSGCGKIKKVEINSNAIVSKDYHLTYSLAAYFGHYVEEFVIGEEVTSIGQYAFSDCGQLSSINIPNHVTSIGEGAFYNCHLLTSINIPSTVTSIGEHAFGNCYNLLTIQVEGGNTVYDSRDNCNALIKTADNTLILGCKNTIIPSSVTSIGDNAFSSCISLASIRIPNSVTYIGFCAFSDCTGLTTIRIPNSVTTIGQYAFIYCTGLKDIYCYAEQVPEIGNDIFIYSNQAKATLHVPASSVGAYQAAEQWKDFKEIVTLPVMDDYRKMVKDGKVWKTGIYGSGNPVRHVEYFYFDGDTIIDGKTCKQMMCQQYYNLDASDDAYISQLSPLSYVGAWYEEDKKVYTYDTINKQFVLMYDFSVDANDTLQINQDDYYVIGPRQTGGLRGFKGVYRDVWFLAEEGNPIYSPFWLEGVGSIDGPTTNVYSGYVDPLRFLMSCTVDDEVIYFNDEYEDGATPEELNANKHRFDFTHTVKTQPKVPGIEGEGRQKRVASADMQSPYGEYSQQLLSIRLEPLEETYVVCITNESNEIIYEKTINTVDIVGLNIDISTYAKGRYTATVENGNESFVGEFEVQATGIENIINKKEDARTYIYNLQGQRIRFLQKGLNIVNGRKVYVK